VSLTAQITALQGKLRVAVVVAELRATVVAERDASIALATTQLERALEIETTSSIAAAQPRSALAETIRAEASQFK
jgi:hypothetical protein